MKKHIFGIRFFASYFLIFGVTNLLLGVIGLLNGGFAGLEFLDFVVSVYAFGIAPFLIVIGFGLFTFKEWARTGFIVVSILKVVFTAWKSILIYSAGNLSLQGTLLGIVFMSLIHGLMILYFFNSNVMNIFSKKLKD